MRIRVAASSDSEAVRQVHLRAFSEGEKREVAALAVNLLSEETTPKTIALVAEADGAVVGHVAFSPVTINNQRQTGYILTPLGVKPDYQKRQIGSKLVESGLERLSKMGIAVVFVYGDPKYYGRFGFASDVASRYSPPYELKYPFGWQAIALSEDVLTAETAEISCVASLSDPALW